MNIYPNRVEGVTLSHKEEGEAARLEEHQHLHKQSSWVTLSHKEEDEAAQHLHKQSGGVTLSHKEEGEAARLEDH